LRNDSYPTLFCIPFAFMLPEVGRINMCEEPMEGLDVGIWNELAS